MDVNALRTWGLAVSAAAMAGALAIALIDSAPQRSGPSDFAPTAEDASAIIVRFQGDGPIARAVRAHDEQAVAAQLGRQTDLAGLCFGSFVEGTDVMLSPCDPAALDIQSLLRRLRAMRSVAYAEVTTAPRAPE